MKNKIKEMKVITYINFFNNRINQVFVKYIIGAAHNIFALDCKKRSDSEKVFIQRKYQLLA